MKRGYTQAIIHENVRELMETGVDEDTALTIAVSYARGLFKNDNPQSVDFPVYLAVNNVRKEYRKFKGGDMNGEKEKEG